MADQRYERGMAVRREMFGHAGSDGKEQESTEYTRELHDIQTRFCYGEVWSRPGLPRNVRSLVTLGMLIALGNQELIAVHVRGAIGNKVTKEEIREVIIHASAYCGAPAAAGAMRVVARTLKEMGLE